MTEHRSRRCRCLPVLWGELEDHLEPFRAELVAQDKKIATLMKKIKRMESDMSALTDVLVRIDEATNEIAAKLADNTAKLVDLAAQLAAALPGSEQAAALQAQIDEAVTVINGQADRLHGLAADPANPVPTV